MQNELDVLKDLIIYGGYRVTIAHDADNGEVVWEGVVKLEDDALRHLEAFVNEVRLKEVRSKKD